MNYECALPMCSMFLCVSRNKNWVPQIKELIADKKTFIAVGAGHLGGPNGVLRLLEKDVPVRTKKKKKRNCTFFIYSRINSAK